jgi:methionyl-tRNA synthetase
MEELLASLGVSLELGSDLLERLSVDPWLKTFTLKPVAPLFTRYDTPRPVEAVAQKAEQPEMCCISFDDFAKVHLRVGTIEACEDVPKSDKLYKLQVNFGDAGMRQICSGIKQHFKPEDLIGKQGVFVFNLQPRKIMGIESQGMMLFVKAHDGHRLVLVTAAENVPNGFPLS